LLRVLSSWFTVLPGSLFFPVLKILYAITEPILSPIRNLLPKTGMFDFSPLVAILLINLIQWFARFLI
tara:strand:- start:179 stop:382 length:204 start_codon:yes stop_codon:yes gene_type:complete